MRPAQQQRVRARCPPARPRAPEVGSLAEQAERERGVGLAQGRRGVERVVDKVGDKGGKAPVVGAVLEQVEERHGRFAKPGAGGAGRGRAAQGGSRRAGCQQTLTSKQRGAHGKEQLAGEARWPCQTWAGRRGRAAGDKLGEQDSQQAVRAKPMLRKRMAGELRQASEGGKQ